MSLKRKLDVEPVEDAPSTSCAKIEQLDLPMEERECKSHNKALCNGFSRLKSEDKFCDFVIVIEGEEIPVHRAVLAASSKYYEAMLCHDTTERKNGRVELQGITLKAGKQCINFMYTGKASFSIENPEELINAAEMMELTTLTDLYFDFLKEKLALKDCLRFLQVAETFGRQSFVKFFENFSIENFEDIAECEELTHMNLSLLEQCLKSISIGSRRLETIKWTTIKRWVNADGEKRQQSFPALFVTIQLDCLPDAFLRSTVLTDPLVKNSFEAKEMIMNAVLSPTQSRPDSRVFSEKVKYIIYCHSESRMLHKHDVGARSFGRFARIPVEVFKKHIDIVSMNGEVFLTSGDAVRKFRDGELVHLLDTGFESRVSSVHCTWERNIHRFEGSHLQISCENK